MQLLRLLKLPGHTVICFQVFIFIFLFCLVVILSLFLGCLRHSGGKVSIPSTEPVKEHKVVEEKSIKKCRPIVYLKG